MNISARKQCVAAGALGAVLLGVVATATVATAEPGDDLGVPVTVTIEDQGELSLSVASTDPVALSEIEGVTDAREFRGTLPTVTVSDTRSDVPEGVGWAVVGSASDFTDAGDPTKTFGGEHLGWTPRLLSAANEGVGEGDAISSVVDDGTGAATVGLEGEELLFSAWDSSEVQAVSGTWQATADLVLRTPADIPSGQYGSTLTLSLFEG